MNYSNQALAIVNIEKKRATISIECKFNRYLAWLKKASLFLIFFDRQHRRRYVAQGKVAFNGAPFTLFDNEQQIEIAIGSFEGAASFGTIHLSCAEGVEMDSFYVKIVQPFGVMAESDWIGSDEPYSDEALLAKTCAVIPCYNVAYFCKDVVMGALAFAGQIVLVDDGSTDDTGPILKGMADQMQDRVHYLPFKKNRGKGFALIAGFQYALDHCDFEVMVTLDGDGQHHGKNIQRIAQKVNEGYEMVIGARAFHQMPFRSRFSNLGISILLKMFYLHAPIDTQSGMRGFSHHFVRDLVKKIAGGHYEMEFKCLLIALKQQRKIASIEIPTVYINKNKSSHYSILRDSFKILGVLFHYGFSKK
ncbi:MAG: glycosyltransferase family 2 protein [Simkaniaceae bacterium]|nr:glycosyltransferase family 2 protein [Simkaniaceae bacterium]MCF7852933.1 glycosyltransferase family 2 protein [Simkaniaceae bacterium]